MGKRQKVTLSIDSKVYDSFRKFCDENGYLLSGKIDLFMKQDLGKNKNE